MQSDQLYLEKPIHKFLGYTQLYECPECNKVFKALVAPENKTSLKTNNYTSHYLHNHGTFYRRSEYGGEKYREPSSVPEPNLIVVDGNYIKRRNSYCKDPSRTITLIPVAFQYFKVSKALIDIDNDTLATEISNLLKAKSKDERKDIHKRIELIKNDLVKIKQDGSFDSDLTIGEREELATHKKTFLFRCGLCNCKLCQVYRFSRIIKAEIKKISRFSINPKLTTLTENKNKPNIEIRLDVKKFIRKLRHHMREHPEEFIEDKEKVDRQRATLDKHSHRWIWTGRTWREYYRECGDSIEYVMGIEKNQHAHVILSIPFVAKQEIISKLWLEATGDSYIVDVRQIKDRVDNREAIDKMRDTPLYSDLKDRGYAQSLIETTWYVLKYVTKMENVDPNDYALNYYGRHKVISSMTITTLDLESKTEPKKLLILGVERMVYWKYFDPNRKVEQETDWGGGNFDMS